MAKRRAGSEGAEVSSVTETVLRLAAPQICTEPSAPVEHGATEEKRPARSRARRAREVTPAVTALEVVATPASARTRPRKKVNDEGVADATPRRTSSRRRRAVVAPPVETAVAVDTSNAEGGPGSCAAESQPGAGDPSDVDVAEAALGDQALARVDPVLGGELEDTVGGPARRDGEDLLQGVSLRSDAARPCANPGGSAPRMRGAARRRWGRCRFDRPLCPFGRRGGRRPHAARDSPGR